MVQKLNYPSNFALGEKEQWHPAAVGMEIVLGTVKKDYKARDCA
jgi:hypothetical protein